MSDKERHPAWVFGGAFVLNLFASKSLKLFLIDAGYFVVAYAAMGLVYALVG